MMAAQALTGLFKLNVEVPKSIVAECEVKRPGMIDMV